MRGGMPAGTGLVLGAALDIQSWAIHKHFNMDLFWAGKLW